MIQLSWNEIRNRAIEFRRAHAANASEAAEKQTFWNEFFTVFGLRRAAVATGMAANRADLFTGAR